MNTTGKLWADLGERALWTLLQGTLAIDAVSLLNLPLWLAMPIMGAISGVKSLLASQFGNGTAATLPASVERLP